MKKRMLALFAVALAVLCTLAQAGCQNSGNTPSGTSTEVVEGSGDQTDAATGDTEAPTGDSETSAVIPVVPPTDTVKLTFNGQSVSGAPEGSVVNEDNAFAIVKPGTYELTGDLSNGQLRVRVAETDRVTLIFNNFTASCSTNAPLYIVEADKCVIELADGSVNRLTDAKTYQFADPAETKPNACLYAGCDLKIKGKGTLIVEGNYNNGIGTKNDLEITGGQITVSAPNNIVKGNNSVTVSGGKLTLSGGEDGIKSDEEVKEGKGYILITEDAVLDITCTDDALQATKSITVDMTARLTVSCSELVNCPGVVNVAENAVTNK